jgi:hypothetical protein
LVLDVKGSLYTTLTQFKPTETPFLQRTKP